MYGGTRPCPNGGTTADGGAIREQEGNEGMSGVEMLRFGLCQRKPDKENNVASSSLSRRARGDHTLILTTQHVCRELL